MTAASGGIRRAIAGELHWECTLLCDQRRYSDKTQRLARRTDGYAIR